MSETDFLEKLDSPEDIARNLSEYLPKFIDVLEDPSYDSYNLKIITSLLGPVAASVAPFDLDKELLCHFLPAVNRAFLSSLNETVSLLERTSEFDEEIAMNLSKYLQHCLNAIDGYFELISVIGQLKNLELSSVKTLMTALPPLLRNVFLHCHESEALYGSYFLDSSTLLSAIFVKSYQVYLSLCKLLESVLFKSYEEDVSILVQIAENLCFINETIVKLDAKATALVWKHFAAFVCKFSKELKERLDMRQPIAHLCARIRCAVTRLVDLAIAGNPEAKEWETTLKLGNFLFRILIRFCELYESYLDGSLSPIFSLLVQICGCSRTSGLKRKEKDDLNRHISVASSALIKLLLSDDQFKRLVEDNLERSFEQDKIGTFFFTILLMKKIFQEFKKHDKWFNYPFVERIFSFYDACENLEDSTIEGMNSYFYIVYTVGLFALVPAYFPLFAQTEKCVVVNLVSPNVETAVFASDVLAFICRNSNEQYCCDVATALWKYLGNWRQTRWRPEYIVVGCTLKRLLEIYPSIRQNFRSENPKLVRWSGVRENSTVKLDWNGDASVCIDEAALVSYSGDSEPIKVDDFANLARAFVTPSPCVKWHENLLVAVFRLGEKMAREIPPQLVEYLLRTISEEAEASVRLKIALCRFIQAIVSLPNRNEATSGVLRKLLDPRENPLVFLKSLLLTDFLPNHVRDSVLTCVQDSKAQRLLKLTSESVDPSDCPVLRASTVHFAHKCIRNEPGASWMSEPATKKIKISDSGTEFSVALCQLKADVSKIKQMVSNESLTVQTRKILNECVDDLEFIKNFA